MRTITLLVLHCSGTRCTHRYTFDQCRADHIQHNRWDDIGYHWYIERDGTLHRGRDEAVKGAHVKYHNNHSIGICYEGGLDAWGHPADTRTPEQRQVLSRLIGELRQRYPRALVVGHRDLSPDLDGNGRITPNEWIKQCPCFDAVQEYGLTQHEPVTNL